MLRHLVSASLLTAAGLAAWAPGHASACGGLFCNSPSAPINQRAERIVFSTDADGAVSAIIEIQYAGPANEFAWILPVAGSPTVGVSSSAALQRLQSATNPTYLLATTVEGECAGTRTSPSFGGGADAGAFIAADASALDGGSHVTVVDAGSAGPYDYVVISIDPAAMPLSDVAFQWLRDNGYYVQPEGAALYQPYLEAGLNLLAFRLTSGRDVGSIRPIRIGFGRGVATVPIRPTAVAATDDMGMLIWVLGPSRAIPVNYRALELNDALIHWLTPNDGSYDAIVTAAANQAGGQGFVTEMAGDAAPIADVVWSSFEESSWASVRAADWSSHEGELLQTALGYVGALDGATDVLRAQLPAPPGVSEADLLSCVSCYYPYGTADIEGFDPVAFLAALDAGAVQPMRDAAAMLRAQPEVTRFYTTMSASEMTMDPSFDFNADLADVSNVHNATRVIECSPSVSISEASWRVQLPDGKTVRGSGSSWPFDVSRGDMPANARILRVGTTGPGDVVMDNASAIDATIAAHNATVRGPVIPTGGGGCSTGGHADARGWMIALAVVGTTLAARRRRR